MAQPKFRDALLLLLLIYAYAILIRIPQFTSDHLLPDQDECVIGMMANHFMKGENFPFFFYGQHYGLSTLEVLLVAAGIKVFGIGVIAIKWPMLLLYLLALTFLFLWIRQKLGLWMAFLITILFAAEPTWLTWAMKARGGYLSALLIGFCLLYYWSQPNFKKYSYVLSGLLLGLLYHFHLLWFLIFLPLFIFYEWKASVKKVFFGLVMMAITILIFNWIAQASIELWYKPKTAFNLDFNWQDWQKNFKLFLGGHFYFGYAYNLKYGTLMAIKLLYYLHLLVFLAAVFLILKQRKLNELMLWFLLTLFSFLLPLLAFKGVFHFRYWLPFSVCFIGLVMLVLKAIEWAPLKKVIIPVVLLIAFFGYRAGRDIAHMDIYEDYFTQDKSDKEYQINDLILNLKKKQEQYLLCNDIALMWLINYYANDEILLRWKISKDRHNCQVQQVNNYYEKQHHIDLLGAKYNFKEWFADTSNLSVDWIHEDYYLLKNPEVKVLVKHGYDFGKEY